MISLATLSLVAARAVESSVRGAHSSNQLPSIPATLAPKMTPIASSMWSHYESRHASDASNDADTVHTTIQALTTA